MWDGLHDWNAQHPNLETNKLEWQVYWEIAEDRSLNEIRGQAKHKKIPQACCCHSVIHVMLQTAYIMRSVILQSHQPAFWLSFQTDWSTGELIFCQANNLLPSFPAGSWVNQHAPWAASQECTWNSIYTRDLNFLGSSAEGLSVLAFTEPSQGTWLLWVGPNRVTAFGKINHWQSIILSYFIRQVRSSWVLIQAKVMVRIKCLP